MIVTRELRLWITICCCCSCTGQALRAWTIMKAGIAVAIKTGMKKIGKLVTPKLRRIDPEISSITNDKTIVRMIRFISHSINRAAIAHPKRTTTQIVTVIRLVSHCGRTRRTLRRFRRRGARLRAVRRRLNLFPTGSVLAPSAKR